MKMIWSFQWICSLKALLYLTKYWINNIQQIPLFYSHITERKSPAPIQFSRIQFVNLSEQDLGDTFLVIVGLYNHADRRF